MSKPVAILKVPPTWLPEAIQTAGPLILRGLSIGQNKSIEETVADIVEGRADLWVVFMDERPIGAFQTAIVERLDGPKSIEVYGLGGLDLPKWGKQLSETMALFAEECGVKRITFTGSKALRRVYTGVREIKDLGEGVYEYERALT